MQIKTDPKVLNYLFYTINKTVLNTKKLRFNMPHLIKLKNHLSRNGLLLEYVNKDFQDNSILVYTAILQNEKALTFASPRLRRIVETSGAEKLIDYPQGFIFIKTSFYRI